MRVTHREVVAEPGRRLLHHGGLGHALLLHRDAHRVPEAGPHQLLQLLSLSGREQTRAPLFGQVGQDGVQTAHTHTRCVSGTKDLQGSRLLP